MNKIAALAMGAMQFGGGMLAQMNPAIIVEFWNAYVLASRIEVPERFMIKIGDDGMAVNSSGQQIPGEQLLAMMSGGGMAGMPAQQQPKPTKSIPPNAQNP
jgi:hypothetical protein